HGQPGHRAAVRRPARRHRPGSPRPVGGRPPVGGPPPADRAGPPGPGHAVRVPVRRPALGPGRPQPRPRRRLVQPPVPEGPRAARPGLLDLVRPHRLRGHRRPVGHRRHRPRARRRGPQDRRRGDRRPGRRRDHRARAGRGQGQPAIRDPPLLRGLRRPDEPAGHRRAAPTRHPDHRPDPRADRRRHPGRRPSGRRRPGRHPPVAGRRRPLRRRRLRPRGPRPGVQRRLNPVAPAVADAAAVADAPVPATGRSRRVAHWLFGTADGRSVVVLVLLPVAFYVVPALLGYPAIAGDNAIQNFPLRVFTGQLVRQGHLPLWNPFIWSGSPLLGGLNAGAFYPLTFAFAILPAVTAWVANLLVVYWAAGLGLYLLGRQLRLRPLPCLLAALTYSFGGAMSGQLVHLGVIQVMGWMPLLVLAQHRRSWAVLGTGPPLSNGPAGAPTGKAHTAAVGEGPHVAEEPGVGAPGGSSIWPWVTLLAAVVGLVALTGEPRSMAEAEVVAAVVTVWLVLRPYGGWAVTAGRRLAFVGWSGLAAVWGAAVAASQLLPGWSFINASQRASESYTYFGTGSLRVGWTTLLLVPDLFGGDGLFGQPTYFNRYNLPEVVGYVGLLPLVAAFALAARSFGRRRDPRSSDWGLWLLLAVLGLVMSWGAFTPAGHLFVHIPLFGKTRLQSRNLGIVDLALAVLLAFWADRALGGRGAGMFTGWRRWVSAAPALAAVVLCVVVLAAPVALEETFGASPVGAALGRNLAPWFAGQLVVGLAAVALVLGWPRLSRAWRPRAVVGLVVVDLFLFLLSTSTGLAPGHVTLEPSTAEATAVLGHDGRFAIYDTTALNVSDLSQIGQPDLNVLTKLPSVQGYGSIVGNTYGTATGTHTLDAVDPCALARGVFTPLRLASLLTLPRFLAPGVTADGKAPPAPPACPGAPAAGTAHRRTFYLGWSVDLSGASLIRADGKTGSGTGPAAGPAAPGGGRSADLRVGVVGPTGRTVWPTETVRTTASGWSVR